MVADYVGLGGKSVQRALSVIRTVGIITKHDALEAGDEEGVRYLSPMH